MLSNLLSGNTLRLSTREPWQLTSTAWAISSGCGFLGAKEQRSSTASYSVPISQRMSGRAVQQCHAGYATSYAQALAA
jgi:hypothetical protein